MKTFNSIFANGNVKSIIAIAVVTISSVFGLSSCDKNDDVFIQERTIVKPLPIPVDTPKKQEAKEFKYKFFASNDILALGDFCITIEYNGNKEVHYASKGTNDIKVFLEKAEDGVDEKFDPKGKTIVVSNVKRGSIVTPTLIPNNEAISALPADGKINIFAAGFVNDRVYFIPMIGSTINPKYKMIGVPNNQVLDYINARFATASAEIKF